MSEFGDLIAGEARSRGLSKMVCTVCPAAKNSTESMKALLAYGFKIESSDLNLIYLIKGL